MSSPDGPRPPPHRASPRTERTSEPARPACPTCPACPDAARPALNVSHVSKSYPTARGPLAVLDDVSLTLAAGDAAAIMGPSGSGKSTLLYLLGALEPPSSGTITLDGQNPFALDEQALARFRNEQIGFVFQDHCLLPQLSVLENVLLPTLVASGRRRRHRPSEGARRTGRARRSRWTTGRRRSRAASGSAPRSPARSSAGRGSCSATSRRATSIARRPRTSPSVLLDLHAPAADHPDHRHAQRTARGEVPDSVRARRQEAAPCQLAAPGSRLRAPANSPQAPASSLWDGSNDARRSRASQPRPLLANEPRRGGWRGRGRHGAGGRAARGRLGARQPAGSRAAAARQHRAGGRVAGVLSRRAGRRHPRRSGVRRGGRPAGRTRGRSTASPSIRQAAGARRACRSTASTIASGRSTARRAPDLADREAFFSPALAREIGAEQGNTVLVRVQRPSAIPLESMHGRKDDVGRTLRLQVGAVLPAAELGEFSLQPQQGDVRAVFVPLARLQQEIELPDRVNVMLVSGQAGGRSAAVRRRPARERCVARSTRRSRTSASSCACSRRRAWSRSKPTGR